ncbi:MAG: hypothetical protein ACEPOW_08845 [Bacteroidales bacterium]
MKKLCLVLCLVFLLPAIILGFGKKRKGEAFRHIPKSSYHMISIAPLNYFDPIMPAITLDYQYMFNKRHALGSELGLGFPFIYVPSMTANMKILDYDNYHSFRIRPSYKYYLQKDGFQTRCIQSYLAADLQFGYLKMNDAFPYYTAIYNTDVRRYTVGVNFRVGWNLVLHPFVLSWDVGLGGKYHYVERVNLRDPQYCDDDDIMSANDCDDPFLFSYVFYEGGQWYPNLCGNIKIGFRF